MYSRDRGTSTGWILEAHTLDRYSAARKSFDVLPSAENW